jgi:outer membrane lipoprotein carrier protein
MQRIKTIALAALGAASLAGTAAGQTDAAIDRAVAAWGKVKSVRGSFEQTVSNSLTGTSANAKGTFVQERPNKLAIHFSDPSSDAIVSDGTALWVYLPSSAPGQVIKRSATDRNAVPIDITGQFLDAPRAKYDITAVGTASAGGHPAHVFRLVAKKGVAAPVSRATIWIDDDDSYIREFEAVEGGGVTRHVRLTALSVNVPVDASAFTFTPPKGVKVVDQSRN